MNLLADEGVDKPIVDLLRIKGHDVKYVLEDNPGVYDEFILAQANTQQRLLLTQDKDFGELVYRLKQVHFGVILIRLEEYPAPQKAQIVAGVLLEHGDKLVKSFTVIQPKLVRIR